MKGKNMCMDLTEKSAELLKKAQETSKPITAYKIILSHGQSPIYAYHRWQPGQNESDRSRVTLTDLEVANNEVHKGFHLLLEKPWKCRRKICEGHNFLSCPYSIVRKCLWIRDVKTYRPQASYALECLVNPQDIVAFGKYNDIEAVVATKVNVLKKEAE